MEISGEIIEVGETEVFGTNGFRKRVLVVETQEQYPQPLPIEFVQDKVDLIGALEVGQQVSVSINLRGREHNGKYYSSIQGWKINQ